MNDSRIDRLLSLLLEEGREVQIHGVSIAEHSLHTAALAWRASAPLSLVTAALLHDVGLLVDEMVGNAGGLDLDPRHEVMGADLLEPIFGATVAEPVRLHEIAGLYLAATDPDYLEGLDPAVRDELLQQIDPDGADPMHPYRIEAFAANPWAAAAVRLRRWDDASLRRQPTANTHWITRDDLHAMLLRVANSAHHPLSA